QRRCPELAKAISKKFEGTTRRGCRIKLPNGTSSSIAWISKRLFFTLYPQLIQTDKILLFHIDFTPHLKDLLGMIALESMRNIFERAHVVGDIFTGLTIPPR